MGRDIHWCLEVFAENCWIGLLASEGNECPAANRNQLLFDHLLIYQLDTLPADISALTEFWRKNSCWEYGFGCMPLAEFMAIYRQTCLLRDPPWPILSETDYFGFDPSFCFDASIRIVYAFDT